MMKYEIEDIVYLKNEKTVSIFSFDEKKGKYTVIDVDSEDRIYNISEKDIFMKLI